MTNDYERQIEHIGSDMTPDDRQLAIINGIQNNLGLLIEMVQRLEQRVSAIEERLPKGPEAFTWRKNQD
jgi:hypothetical protein